MTDEQHESAGLYVQCLALWLAGAIAYVAMYNLAGHVIPVAGPREFTFRTGMMYVGVLLLAGIVFNATLFIVARFSPVVRVVNYRGINAAVFIATTLLVSLFFVMSRIFYTSRGAMADPRVVYPFVALVIVLTLAIVLVCWIYYRAEFAAAKTNGRFWFSFVALSLCLFFSLALLVFFNEGSRVDRFNPFSFSMNIVFGLGWILVHALLVRAVWIPLAKRKGGKG